MLITRRVISSRPGAAARFYICSSSAAARRRRRERSRTRYARERGGGGLEEASSPASGFHSRPEERRRAAALFLLADVIKIQPDKMIYERRRWRCRPRAREPRLRYSNKPSLFSCLRFALDFLPSPFFTCTARSIRRGRALESHDLKCGIARSGIRKIR